MDQITSATPFKKFHIKTTNAELISIDSHSRPGATVVQLIIFDPRDDRGEQRVRDIKEQVFALPELDVATHANAVIGWARVVREMLMQPGVEVQMPKDFFRGFESALKLKKAKSVEDYQDAFRAKSRLGQWIVTPIDVGTESPLEGVLEKLESTALDTPALTGTPVVLIEVTDGYGPPMKDGLCNVIDLGEGNPEDFSGVPVVDPHRRTTFHGILEKAMRESEPTMSGPSDAELDEIEALEPPSQKVQATFESIAALAHAPLPENWVDHFAQTGSMPKPPPTPSEKLLQLKAKLDQFVGVPNGRKKRAEVEKQIRRLTKKASQIGASA